MLTLNWVKKDQAVENYKKAGKAFADDTFNSSEYLYRAAVLLADQNKTADAIALLKEIKKEFSDDSTRC